MTTTEEHIAAIRKALDAGPTPGEWKTQAMRADGLITRVVGDSDVIAGLDGICEPDRITERTFEESRRNMDFIASCDPVAISAVLSELDRLKEENERMRAQLNGCDWYWPEDDTSSDACADGPWQIAENVDLDQAEILAYLRGGVVETRYYAFLPPADDADSDDNFEVDCSTREDAEAGISAEIARRAAIKGEAQ